jgi:hypothetical protein
MPWTAIAERPTMSPIMAMTTKSSTREKARRERRPESGWRKELTTEDTENTEGDTKGVERVTWFTKVGADRRDAPFLRRSLPS